MHIRSLTEGCLSWRRDLDIVPYSVSLDVRTPSNGIHTQALNIRLKLKQSEDPSIQPEHSQPIGITVLCKGKQPIAALLWRMRDVPDSLTDSPKTFLAAVTTESFQTLFDMAVDLTPPDRLARETARARLDATTAIAEDDTMEARFKNKQKDANTRLRRLPDGPDRAALEAVADMDHDANERAYRISHEKAERAKCRWHLLDYANGRRQMPIEDRQDERERIKKFRTTQPRP
ncbi:MAG: hypothetical protein WC787_02070 [Patescibacteria group bacterium]|jgi:hypothetical protein